MNNIIRSITRNSKDRLRCLVLCKENEKYLKLLSNCNCDLYILTSYDSSEWKPSIEDIPPNIFSLNSHVQESALSFFDCIIIQDRLQEYDIGIELSSQLHIPIINIDHAGLDAIQKIPYGININVATPLEPRLGNVSVAINEEIKKSWSSNPHDVSLCVPLYVDSEKYKPLDKTIDLVIDNNVPQPSLDLLGGVLERFKTESLFRNNRKQENILGKARLYLSTWKGIDLKILEAMSAGCAVITQETEDIKSLIKHGENGFLFSNINELESILEEHIGQDTGIGQNARRTIESDYSDLESFVNKWNQIFSYTSNLFYNRS